MIFEFIKNKNIINYLMNININNKDATKKRKITPSKNNQCLKTLNFQMMNLLLSI